MVSHKSHSSLLLEISHFFSCSQPATSLGWSSIQLWGHVPVETVWHVPGSWTQPLCGQKSCATAWCVPCCGTWGPEERSRGCCGHTGQLALLPFLSQIAVFTCLFPQIFRKYTGGRAECYQAPAALLARVNSVGIHHLPFQNPFRYITAPAVAQTCW